MNLIHRAKTWTVSYSVQQSTSKQVLSAQLEETVTSSLLNKHLTATVTGGNQKYIDAVVAMPTAAVR